MTLIARTRAEVDVRSAPQPGAAILDRLPTDCPVNILEDLTRWYKITPAGLLHFPAGYLPQMALVFPPDTSITVFPSIPVSHNQPASPSVPEELKLNVFLAWLSNPGKPGWLSDQVWSGLSAGQQADLIKKLRIVTAGVKPRWDDWVANISQHLRLNEALHSVLITRISGFKDSESVFSIPHGSPA